MTNFELVKEFHKAFDLNKSGSVSLWTKLIDEEHEELIGALEDGFEHTAKELADLLYVTYGLAVYLQLDIDNVFAEVHRSNMSKLGEDGKPIYREDGKVLKGPNYKAPDLKDFI